MTTQISTQTISFNNQALITFEQDGKHYTAMKPICENIGLAWEAQLARIKRDDILSSTMIVMIIVAEDGKQREMICLPIEYLNGWLFGIDVNRCKLEIRETLIKYKKECYQALHDYWFKGKAERSQNPEQNRPLAQIEADQEAVQVITKLFHSLNGAYELATEIQKNQPWLARELEKQIGGHFIYNLQGPTRNSLDNARKYIQAKSERIAIVRGMLSLLDGLPMPQTPAIPARKQYGRKEF